MRSKQSYCFRQPLHELLHKALKKRHHTTLTTGMVKEAGLKLRDSASWHPLWSRGKFTKPRAFLQLLFV